MPESSPWPLDGRMRRMIITRHGQTTLNRHGLRCGGDVDIELTDEGRRQIAVTAARLVDEFPEIDVILTSPLRRTRESVEIIRRVFPRSVEVRDELIERRLGDWNGRSIVDTEPLLKAGVTPPGGESSDAFSRRVLTFLDWLAETPYRHPLVVASKGIARVIGTRFGATPGVPLGNGEILVLPPGPVRAKRAASDPDVHNEAVAG